MVTFSTKDQFQALQDATSDVISKVFPIEGKKNIVRLKKHYIDDTLEADDFEGQKKTKIRGGTWGVPVYGDLELVDRATGKVIDQQSKVKLMNIPKITPRSSYIVNGNEYQVSSQLRRMPGIYTFRKQTGDEFKTVFNLAKGRNFDINFDPKTLKYTMKVGQANPPLYPVLKALGVSDETLHSTWGKEILDANRKRASEENANKIAKTLIGNDKATSADLKEYFSKTELHPEMSEKLLGVKSNSITPEVLVKSTHKLLEVYRGKQKPDDAESLIYKEVHSVDDFVKDKFKKNLQSIQGKFKRNVDSKEKLKQIISPSVLNKQIESFFTTDERSNATEQYNPLHMLGSHYKISIMGPGGVSSEHMITPEMREVHASHLGFLDPIHTPESSKVGATMHLPFAVEKSGNKLLTKVFDVKSKKYVSISPLDLHSKNVGFPDQANFEGGSFKGFTSDKVKVQHQGELKEVPRSAVDVILPTTKSLFSFSTNLIPFLKNNQANRATFAAKQMEQAVPLVREHREAPLVRTLASKSGATFNDVLGVESSHRSPADGTIVKVAPNEIHIKSGLKTHSVNLYNDFPLNQTTMMNSEPVVKVGDKVKKNQLIADSNFTKNGTLALGTNLRTAYMVWPGATFEDGIAISQSAAKKLTSEHSYKYDHKSDENTRLNLKTFKIEFPSALSKENQEKLDDNGVIKKGSVVKSGDVLVASMQKRVASPEELILQKTHRSLKNPMQNNSVVFNNDFDGIVTDVLHTPKGVKVVIKTKEEARVGDKLTGQHGNKGIISAIVPDHEAPRNKAGEIVDVMLNPHGVISRINIGQLYESAAGKLASKTGKPYVVENFDNIDHKSKITEELKKHGLTDKEELFDANGKLLGNVHVGKPHILKLFKTGQSVISARGAGGGYAYDRMNMQPIRGGEEGSKAMDTLTNYAMLSHDSRNIMREMATVKGEKSDEFWNAFRQGRTLPPPKTPFVFNKFLNMLHGAGVDVQKNGSQYKILPQTDEQVKKMSRGAIKSAEFVNAKDLKPRKDGFFDEKVAGGLFGNQFNHIELPEKLPNPVFEDSIKKLTGITDAQYKGLIGGTHAIDSKGKVVHGSGITGGKAFENLLGKINVDEEIKKHEKVISHGSPKDENFKKLKLLKTLKENKMSPSQAYLKGLVPVLPPIFRPIYPIDDGSLNVSPVNNLYQHVHLLSDSMKLSAVNRLDSKEKGTIRSELYHSQGALAGLEDALTQKGQATPGLIAQIAGSQPKEGFFLNKVIRKQQDLTARGTIVPNSDLHVDEIGVPEKAAWKIFEPFITQKMVRYGKTPITAKKEIEEKTDFAKKLLGEVMDERPVMYNRAPSLHKFSIMAGKPKLVSGNAIHIPHLIVKGLGADFDGDDQIGSVVVFLSNDVQKCFGADFGDTFLETRKVAARFKEKIPVLRGGDVFIFNLEDFPKSGLVKSKTGKNGKIDFHSVEKGVKVLSYDEKNHTVEWKDVSNWSKHYNREVIVVTLQSGRQIVTDDDPRALYGIKSGSIETTRYTPDEAVSLGLLVPRSSRLDVFGDVSTIKPAKINRGGKAYLLHEEILLNSDFGYLVGAIVGDGWCSAGRDVCIASITKEIPEKIDAVIDSIFKGGKPKKCTINSRESYGESRKHTYTSIELVELISPMVGHSADFKHLPPFFMSACEDFRSGLFAGLMDTDGSISISNGKSKPQLMSNFSSNSIRLIQEVQLLASSLGIRGRITASTTPAGKRCWMLAFSNVDIKNWGGKHMVHPDKLTKLASIEVKESSAVLSKNDVIPLPISLAEVLRKEIGCPRNTSGDRKTNYFTLCSAMEVGSISRLAAKKLCDFVSINTIINHKDGKKWLSLIEDENVTWDRVVSIEKTGIREDGYDLTVPGHETFMNVDGVILSNTMTMHVPISQDAINEAKNMFPSKHLFKPGSGQVMMLPDQEGALGTFMLSQTKEGRDLVNKLLPKDLHIKEQLNAKSAKKLFSDLAKNHPKEFPVITQNMKNMSEKKAYSSGFSLGLEDLHIIKDRDKIIHAAEKKAIATKNAGGSVEEIYKHYTDANKELQGKMFSDVPKENPFRMMVESGSRGNKAQMQQIMASPLILKDTKDRPILIPVKKSYTEGLPVSDYFISLYGARKGMMDRALQTSLPGAFTKDLMANVVENVVSKADCGTKSGIHIPLHSADALDRYTSHSNKGIPANTLITPDIVKKAESLGLKTLNVRSPLKCLDPKGVCAKCFGPDEHGKDPHIGRNLGALTGQALTEPLTQMRMKAIHSGGMAGAQAEAVGFEKIQQLFNLPKHMTGVVPLSDHSGKISSITKSPAGGHVIHVGEHEYKIPTGAPIIHKVGDSIKPGDPLAFGPVHPMDILKHKGIDETRNYLSDQLQQTYKDQGAPIHRKFFENVVRTVSNVTHVKKAPLNSPFQPGDMAPLSQVQAYNTSNPSDPIHHSPTLIGLTRLPMSKKNWMAQLGYRYAKEAIKSGASEGWSTDVQDYHPIPAFAHGATFGKGKEGKY